MTAIQSIPVSAIEPDPDQPRKHFDEAVLLALGQNMAQVGQQVPLIVYDSPVPQSVGKRFRLADGERRWRAAQLVNIPEVSAIVLASKPSSTELAVIQASIDIHRVNLSPTERANVLARIQQETQCAIGDLAKQVGISQAYASKLLAIRNLPPDTQAKLDAGELDIEKAYVISQADDRATQDELAKLASTLSRDQLRQRVKRGNAVEPKAGARFKMPGGMTVAVQGRELTLSCVVEVLAETVRILKKGLSQGLDITTQMRVMKDQAKPKSASH